WETAYARAYSLQVSANARSWTDVYVTDTGKGGLESIAFKPVTARYLRMLGRKRATEWGYSLYDLEVYGQRSAALSDVQFIRLLLKDAKGRLQSGNFYWRSSRMADYTALNSLPPVQLKVSSTLARQEDSTYVRAVITNPASSAGPAFAVHVQLLRADNNGRVLPAVMNDNYFTLLKGESKQLE